MSDAGIETKGIFVQVQANGICRRDDTGYLIARLCDGVEYANLPDESVKQPERAKADNQRLREKGQSLVDILDVVDKAIGGAFAFMAIHSMPYTGPNYSKEREALRAALASTEPEVCRWTTRRDGWGTGCGEVTDEINLAHDWCGYCGKSRQVWNDGGQR